MKRLIISLMFLGLPILAVPSHAVAVDVFGKDVCDRSEASGATACKDSDLGGKDPITGDQGVITTIINLLTTVVAIIAVIMIILAGFRLVTSSTNPQDVSNSRERIIYAIIALVVAAVAQGVVRFIVSKL